MDNNKLQVVIIQTLKHNSENGTHLTKHGLKERPL